MNFLFDNNLPPALARAIAALCDSEADVQQVAHLRELFDGSTPDVEWLAALSQSPWYVVSIDKFKKKGGAEREAIRRAGHTVYVLDSQWSSRPFWDKSHRLVQWWPTILAHARLTAGGAYRIPLRWTPSARLATT